LEIRGAMRTSPPTKIVWGTPISSPGIINQHSNTHKCLSCKIKLCPHCTTQLYSPLPLPQKNDATQSDSARAVIYKRYRYHTPNCIAQLDIPPPPPPPVQRRNLLKYEATSLIWSWFHIAGNHKIKQVHGFCWFSLKVIFYWKVKRCHRSHTARVQLQQIYTNYHALSTSGSLKGMNEW
jgi:hypothetical protein